MPPRAWAYVYIYVAYPSSRAWRQRSFYARLVALIDFVVSTPKRVLFPVRRRHIVCDDNIINNTVQRTDVACECNRNVVV